MNYVVHSDLYRSSTLFAIEMLVTKVLVIEIDI